VAEAASAREKELREADAAERALSGPPTRKLGETNDEFLARGFASLHAQQQYFNHLRIAALDAAFAKDESDALVIAGLFTTAIAAGNGERIALTGRVVERRLRVLAEGEERAGSGQRPASEAYARVRSQIEAYRAETEASTPAGRRASAMQRFTSAVTAAGQRANNVRALVVGVGPKRPGA
jgi:hypothetical protein